jgi:hypothetical protein
MAKLLGLACLSNNNDMVVSASNQSRDEFDLCRSRAGAKVTAAPYEVELPAGTQAKVLRRAEISCFPITGCMAVLIPLEEPKTNAGQW